MVSAHIRRGADGHDGETPTPPSLLPPDGANAFEVTPATGTELPAPPGDPEVADTLGVGKHRSTMAWLGPLLVVLLLAGGGLLAYRMAAPPEGPTFVTRPAARGDLTVRVTATGTLAPRTLVDIGPEISGRVAEILVDHNDHVKAGQVLARLDTDLLDLQVSQARAQLASSRAAIAQAQAAQREAERTLARVKTLAARKVVTPQDLDQAQAAFDRADAAVDVTKAQRQTAEAAYGLARANLKNAIILSPIDGVVISRLVEPGQVVVAALQAPVLFRLAEDLTRMELTADIDEADIGRIEEGQEATFTVAAYPERSFTAKLTAVHNAPRTAQQVVTYEALFAVENNELLLRPGMTVTVQILTAQYEDALLVPNAALRYQPPKKKGGDEEDGPLLRPTGKNVWVLEGGAPRSVEVVTGGTDGERSRIVSGELEAGDAVIIDDQREAP